MARRTKDRQSLSAILQLAGFAVLIGLIYPPFRHAMSAVGFLVIWLLWIGLAGLVGFVVYRFVMGPTRRKEVVLTTAVETLRVTVPIQEKKVPPAPDLLTELRSIDWFQFEKVVELLYRKRGYTVTRRGGANPDGGIDLVIERDGQRTAVQCKHWKTWKVGVQPVREFLGALTDSRIRKGIFITLSSYSNDAERLAEKHGIEILDGYDLRNMFEGINGRSDSEVLAILRDTRKICPKCEREMVLRTAGKGRGMGQTFWGCSRYPRCKFTMPFDYCMTGSEHIRRRHSEAYERAKATPRRFHTRESRLQGWKTIDALSSR